jgi:hypothetical protein
MGNSSAKKDTTMNLADPCSAEADWAAARKEDGWFISVIPRHGSPAGQFFFFWKNQTKKIHPVAKNPLKSLSCLGRGGCWAWWQVEDLWHGD